MSLIERQKQIMDSLQAVYAGVITHGDTIDVLSPKSSPGLIMEEAQRALMGIAEVQANLNLAKMYTEALITEARREVFNAKL